MDDKTTDQKIHVMVTINEQKVSLILNAQFETGEPVFSRYSVLFMVKAQLSWTSHVTSIRSAIHLNSSTS